MKKLNQAGFSHWILPLIVVAVIAFIGVRVLTGSHADTVDPCIYNPQSTSNSGCNATTNLQILNSYPLYATAAKTSFWFTNDNLAGTAHDQLPTSPNLGVLPFGSTSTSAIQEFANPTSNAGLYGVTADGQGNIWYVENGANKIAELPAGSTSASSIREFNIPTANSNSKFITATKNGNIWFTEQTGKVGELIPSSGTINETDVGSTDLAGITAGPNNTVWFSNDAYPYSIDKLNKYGQLSKHKLTYMPKQIAENSDGSIWFNAVNSTTTPYNVIGTISSGKVITYPMPNSIDVSQTQNKRVLVGGLVAYNGNVWFTVGLNSPSTIGLVGEMNESGVYTIYNPYVNVSALPWGIAYGNGNLLTTNNNTLVLVNISNL
jgi:streptogramin lyase